MAEANTPAAQSNNEQMHAAFEAEMLRAGVKVEFLERYKKDDGYHHPTVHERWMGWQACVAGGGALPGAKPIAQAYGIHYLDEAGRDKWVTTHGSPTLYETQAGAERYCFTVDGKPRPLHVYDASQALSAPPPAAMKQANEDEMRHAFENCKQYRSKLMFKRGGSVFAEDVPPGDYVDAGAQAAWVFWQEAWQASDTWRAQNI